MKNLPATLLFCIAVLSACNSKPQPQQSALAVHNTATPAVIINADKKNSDAPAADTLAVAEDDVDTFEPRYLVIADTSLSYSALKTTMLGLHEQTGLNIDTLGRFYDAKKDLIRLPDDADDEIYAGDYFMRRTDGEFLSIEYLNTYKPAAAEKGMALVAGIYETDNEARKGLSKVKATAGHSFILKADIYMGCTH